MHADLSPLIWNNYMKQLTKEVQASVNYLINPSFPTSGVWRCLKVKKGCASFEPHAYTQSPSAIMAIRSPRRLFHKVGSEYNDSSLPHFLHQIPKSPPRIGVHAGGRLVEKHHLRPPHKGNCHAELPFLPSWQNSCQTIGLFRKIDIGEEAIYFFLAHRSRHVLYCAEKIEVFPEGSAITK